MSFSIDSVVIGKSARMRVVFDFVRGIAESESNVLITGETGTGKEVVAQLIHHSGPRRRKPFIAVSCAILTESLIETELFGHERGAFTGAVVDRAGRFELADGGTLFLDDVDDVPASVQVKLLRALQQRTVERVGGTRQIPVDVRIIAGTKRPLTGMVAEGTFRPDLFYRLDVISIPLPPLRDRREDIPILTDHFLQKYFAGRDVPPLSQTVRSAFQRYPWPGNVRELENACERMAQTCRCSRVRCGCMPSSILFHAGTPATLPTIETAGGDGPAVAGTSGGISLDDHLEKVESSLIEWALTACSGNKSKAAELLLISRSTLGDRIRRLRRIPGSVRLGNEVISSIPE